MRRFFYYYFVFVARTCFAMKIEAQKNNSTFYFFSRIHCSTNLDFITIDKVNKIHDFEYRTSA
jgi:hypothetical protein